jgi:RNA polymerase sigma-70 factor, ECF subfamily
MQDIRVSSNDARDEPRREIEGLYDLMEQYIDGDDRAFARLYGLLVPRVRARLGRIVRDPVLVDDLAQLTFMRAHQARERFVVEDDGADRAVEAWYVAIARNVALDHLRHDYRRERRHSVLEARGDVAGMGAPQPAPNAEELNIEQEAVARTVQRVHAALERLPAGQREVVRLHKLGGLSMAQIAGRLGVRPGALRVRAHRAYKALQTVLMGDLQGPVTAKGQA